jgi:hypothetical protein
MTWLRLTAEENRELLLDLAHHRLLQHSYDFLFENYNRAPQQTKLSVLLSTDILPYK